MEKEAVNPDGAWRKREPGRGNGEKEEGREEWKKGRSRGRVV